MLRQRRPSWSVSLCGDSLDLGLNVPPPEVEGQWSQQLMSRGRCVLVN